MVFPSGPRAQRLTVALYLCLALSALGAASAFSQWHLLNEAIKGHSIPTDVALANDSRHFTLVTALLVLVVVTGLLYFNWLYNSVRNVREIRGLEMRATPGWAIAYWFIPIVNFFRPYQTVRDLWRRSSEEIKVKELPPPIGLWWLAYLVGGVLGSSAERLEAVESLRLSAGLETTSKVLLVVAAYLLIRIVGAIDAAQSEWPAE
jgi:hypothetical protein